MVKYCLFDDKGMNLGTMKHYRVLQIFEYRAIRDLTFGDLYVPFLLQKIGSLYFCLLYLRIS